MLFTTLPFLVFLPMALAAVRLAPPGGRWLAMLVASAVFYGWNDATDLLYPAALILFVWLLGHVLDVQAGNRRRAMLALGLVVVLGSLVLFKLGDVLLAEAEAVLGLGMLPRVGIEAPPGYSFQVFAAASYLIDIHRRGLNPAGLRAIATWLGWFPKLVAGPIERAGTFLEQLRAPAAPEPNLFAAGLQLILWGLVKKVVVADSLAPLVDRTFAIVDYAAPMDLLMAVYFFTIQIYCDFSGYTDMAIGVSLLFGIRLSENFRRPYLARSTAEFWADRWHISLGRWFRDYLYIPLGGGRVGSARRAVNVMVVFLASGLWHAGLGYGVGWTFLVWGALNGLYQWIGMLAAPVRRRAAARLPRLGGSRAIHVFDIVFTFHLIAIAWVVFRAETVGDAWTVLARIAAALPSLPSLLSRYPFTAEHAQGFVLIAGLLAAEALGERRPWRERLGALPRTLRWPVYYAGLAALLVLGDWGMRPFVYMQF
jgi:alginate O-acetyltransferase complex protein AlgI